MEESGVERVKHERRRSSIPTRSIQPARSSFCVSFPEQLESELEASRRETSTVGSTLEATKEHLESLTRNCAGLQEQGEELQKQKAAILEKVFSPCNPLVRTRSVVGLSSRATD